MTIIKKRPTRFFLERGRERIYIGHSFMPDYGFCFAFLENTKSTLGAWKSCVKKKVQQGWTIRDNEFNVVHVDEVIDFALHCNFTTDSGFFEKYRDSSGIRFAVVRDTRKEIVK